MAENEIEFKRREAIRMIAESIGGGLDLYNHKDVTEEERTNYRKMAREFISRRGVERSFSEGLILNIEETIQDFEQKSEILKKNLAELRTIAYDTEGHANFFRALGESQQ